MRSFRTAALLAAGASIAAVVATGNPAAAVPAAPSSPAAHEAPATPRITGCHIRAINDGVRIRQAADPNAVVDGLLYRGQTLPSDCAPFKGAGHGTCVNGGWGTEWIGVTFNGRRDYVSASGDCTALHLS